MKDRITEQDEMKKGPGFKGILRFLFAAAAIYGAAELLGSLAAWIAWLLLADPVLHAGEASSIGIIGGADGPTAIFVTTPDWTGYVVPVLALAVGICGFLYFSRRKQK